MIALQFKNIGDSVRFRRSEWGCSAATAGWGWIIVQPYETFDNPSFVVMRHWADENTWGWTAVLIGLASLWVMIYNGRFKHFPEARMMMAGLRVIFWMSLVYGLVRANIWAPGIAAYGSFLAMDLHTVYTASYEADLNRKARRNGAP